jgi:hypothetical protein
MRISVIKAKLSFAQQAEGKHKDIFD